MIDVLRPFLSRLLAILLGTGAAWLAAHYGINFDADTPHQLADALIGVILPIFVGVYATSHKAFDKKLNPEDAASTHAAALGKAKQRQRKATRATEERIKQAGVDAGHVPPLDKVPASEKGL